jgi:hypothetical protein
MKIDAAKLLALVAVLSGFAVGIHTAFADPQLGDATKLTVPANGAVHELFTVPRDNKKHSIRIIFQVDNGGYVSGYLMNPDQYARYVSNTRKGDYDEIAWSVNDADDGALDYSITADLDGGDYDIVFSNTDSTPATMRMVEVRDYYLP